MGRWWWMKESSNMESFIRDKENQRKPLTSNPAPLSWACFPISLSFFPFFSCALLYVLTVLSVWPFLLYLYCCQFRYVQSGNKRSTNHKRKPQAQTKNKKWCKEQHKRKNTITIKVKLPKKQTNNKKTWKTTNFKKTHSEGEKKIGKSWSAEAQHPNGHHCLSIHFGETNEKRTSG